MNLKRSIDIRLSWSAESTPADVCTALRQLSCDYPQLIENGKIGRRLNFVQLPEGSGCCTEVTRDQNDITIKYRGLAGALRGVGAAMSDVCSKDETSFERLGIMLDCSRNKVISVEHLKHYICRMALMGYNLVQLYCEDTYQLPDEPFFGYMRGGWTVEELKEVDAFAQKLGIEVMGCIELLGHFSHVLKWTSAYSDITDAADVLLIDEPKTYELIDKILKFWSEALSSRRINIGLDEAHEMGRGKYWDQHGPTDIFELFNRHLAKVNDICHKYGFKTQIWSDMYFRIADKKNHNYYCDEHIPAEVAAKIPKDIELVYWDYYHQDQKVYESMMDRHIEVGFKPPLASGIWTWGGGFWYNHTQTKLTAIPGIAAARSRNLTELTFTMWGDNGGYCDYDSALSGLCFCADLAFGQEDEKKTSKRFLGVCGANYEGTILAGELFDTTDENGENEMVSPSWLLYDDPLLGVYSEQIRCIRPDYESMLAERLRQGQKKLRHFHSQCAGDFDNLNKWLKLLIHKLEMRTALTTAYDRRDMAALKTIATTGVRTAVKLAREFAASFRRSWLNSSKPFGLEIMEIRNAGLIARFESLGARLQELLDGKIKNIPELDARRPLNGKPNYLYLVERCQSPCYFRHNT